MRDIEYGTIRNQQSPKAEELSVDTLLNSPGALPVPPSPRITRSGAKLNKLTVSRSPDTSGPRRVIHKQLLPLSA
jgi:hypothetical protein